MSRIDIQGEDVDILILGDGNFSFAASFAQTILVMGSASDVASYTIVATSFDSSAQLLEKYPEANHNLRKLDQLQKKSSGGIGPGSSRAPIVNTYSAHNIDATQDLRAQLERELGAVATRQSRNNFAFSYIIFNFPHLGVESEGLHRQLLGHFLHRANEVLRRGGLVCISLADRQAERWALGRVAVGNGFEEVAAHPFPLRALPGYEMKRHQAARSFSARVSSSMCHVFRRACDETLTHNLMGELEKISRKALQNSSLFDPCTTAIAHNKKPLDTLADKEKCEDPGSLSSSAGVGGAGDPVTPFAKKRKRGKLTAAESGYECRPRVGGASERTSGVGEGEIEFACKSCDKTFRLEQGARTHVYMVHILTSGTDSDIYSKCAIGEPVGPTEVPSTTCLQEEPAGSDSLYCPICEVPEKLSFIVVDTAEGLRRSFSSPDALQQHMRAKHASPSAAPPAEETKTDTTRTTSYVFSDDAPSTGGDMYGVYVCGLCGLALDSPEGLERHLSEGVAPPPVCQLLCASCGRTFVNERALRQHAVACNSHIKSLYDAM